MATLFEPLYFSCTFQEKEQEKYANSFKGSILYGSILWQMMKCAPALFSGCVPENETICALEAMKWDEARALAKGTLISLVYFLQNL